MLAFAFLCPRKEKKRKTEEEEEYMIRFQFRADSYEKYIALLRRHVPCTWKSTRHNTSTIER